MQILAYQSPVIFLSCPLIGCWATERANLRAGQKITYTGKSLSEALIFASSNPQYDNRLFIIHENCKLRIPAEHVVYPNGCFCFVSTFRAILVHNMFCRCCELLKKIYLYLDLFFLTASSTITVKRICLFQSSFFEK